ncbi:MAG: hypothetical protein ACSHX0_11335 [Akkermansiaceae bacterium]
MIEGHTEQKQVKDSKNVLLSFLGLIAVLAGIFYLYPMLRNQSSDNVFTVSTNNEKAEEEAEVQNEGMSAVSPDELKPWLAILQDELLSLEKLDGSSYQILHFRRSGGGDRLLIDLKKSSTGGSVERLDLILERDQFGRYISQNSLIPIKFYPPEK